MSTQTRLAKKKNPSMMSQRRRARSLCMQALYQWHLNAYPSNELAAQFLVGHAKEMEKADSNLFTQLLTGVLNKIDELDKQFVDVLDRDLADLDFVELAVLRLGTYELMYRPEVPYRVVINEEVELSKIFGATDSYRYINGVLDKLAKAIRPAEAKSR